jgi:hypothetical protein
MKELIGKIQEQSKAEICAAYQDGDKDVICSIKGDYHICLGLVGSILYGIHKRNNISMQQIGKDLGIIMKANFEAGESDGR